MQILGDLHCDQSLADAGPTGEQPHPTRLPVSAPLADSADVPQMVPLEWHGASTGIEQPGNWIYPILYRVGIVGEHLAPLSQPLLLARHPGCAPIPPQAGQKPCQSSHGTNGETNDWIADVFRSCLQPRTHQGQAARRKAGQGACAPALPGRRLRRHPVIIQQSREKYLIDV